MKIKMIWGRFGYFRFGSFWSFSETAKVAFWAKKCFPAFFLSLPVLSEVGVDGLLIIPIFSNLPSLNVKMATYKKQSLYHNWALKYEFFGNHLDSIRSTPQCGHSWSSFWFLDFPLLLYTRECTSQSYPVCALLSLHVIRCFICCRMGQEGGREEGVENGRDWYYTAIRQIQNI